MTTRIATLSLLLLLALPLSASAHSVNYRVENKGVSTRLFYAGDDPLSYSAYELFGPGDSIAYKKGRTDRNGVVSFLPDRPGKWVVKVTGEAAHGPHGAQIEVEVDAGLDMESFHKPLVAQYLKGFIGMSIILSLFSGWVLWRNYRRDQRTTNNHSLPGRGILPEP